MIDFDKLWNKTNEFMKLILIHHEDDNSFGKLEYNFACNWSKAVYLHMILGNFHKCMQKLHGYFKTFLLCNWRKNEPSSNSFNCFSAGSMRKTLTEIFETKNDGNFSFGQRKSGCCTIENYGEDFCLLPKVLLIFFPTP
jgi:hypothetical protein